MRRYWFPKHRGRVDYPLACRLLGHSLEQVGSYVVQCRRCKVALSTPYKGKRR